MIILVCSVERNQSGEPVLTKSSNVCILLYFKISIRFTNEFEFILFMQSLIVNSINSNLVSVLTLFRPGKGARESNHTNVGRL